MPTTMMNGEGISRLEGPAALGRKLMMMMIFISNTNYKIKEAILL